MKEYVSVSVVVPTYNNQATIAPCLEAIFKQSSLADEVIVVDNFSTDLTLPIAKRYPVIAMQHGNERSEQANIGVGMATSDYILRLDADFVLGRTVLEACRHLVQEGCDAVEVHNSPDPSISWIARARRFEYDLLRGDPVRSSARFVRRDLYLSVGGLDVNLDVGEDFDFQNRLLAAGAKFGISEVDSISIREPVNLIALVRKFFTYGSRSVIFRDMPNRKRGQIDGASAIQKLYLKKWRRYLDDPVGALFFIAYFTIKVFVGGVGILWGTISARSVLHQNS